MFRHQIHVQVRLGKGRDYFAAFEELEKYAMAKKLPASQLWTNSFGKINGFVIVTDYDTIAAYDAGLKAFLSDAEFMTQWRKALELVDETPWDELWETASQGA